MREIGRAGHLPDLAIAQSAGQHRQEMNQEEVQNEEEERNFADGQRRLKNFGHAVIEDAQQKQHRTQCHR